MVFSPPDSDHDASPTEPRFSHPSSWLHTIVAFFLAFLKMAEDISSMHEARSDLDDDYEDGDLLTQLTRGFEALMGKVDSLTTLNDRLQRQLNEYRQEVRSNFF